MNPIFKEYCQFLNDMTINKEEVVELQLIKEGYFWLDNSIIKCFDKEGTAHKILRIEISDDLKYIRLKKLKNGYSFLKDIELASWNDLVEINSPHLHCVESESVELIKDKMSQYNDYIPIIPVSMGKDSIVTAHLVRSINADIPAIFNNTTLDCSDTYKIAKTYPNCNIMTPKEGFYQYIERDNIIPTRFARFCCRMFKVGEMVNQLDHDQKYLFFMGMRNQESETRSDYEDEWVNKSEWGDTRWQGILPIRKWTELDVWLYTFWKQLEINSKYKKGYSRVGCAIACPYYTKSTWMLDVYWYPSMRKRWEEILRKDFVDNSKWIVMNCTIDEYINSAWSGGVYRPEPTIEVVEEFATYKELDIKIAKQYFNKYCNNGCKNRAGKLVKIKDKEVLGMNMKLHGRETNKFLCKNCLMKIYDLNNERWDEKVREFTENGCKLF